MDYGAEPPQGGQVVTARPVLDQPAGTQTPDVNLVPLERPTAGLHAGPLADMQATHTHACCRVVVVDDYVVQGHLYVREGSAERAALLAKTLRAAGLRARRVVPIARVHKLLDPPIVAAPEQPNRVAHKLLAAHVTVRRS